MILAVPIVLKTQIQCLFWVSSKLLAMSPWKLKNNLHTSKINGTKLTFPSPKEEWEQRREEDWSKLKPSWRNTESSCPCPSSSWEFGDVMGYTGGVGSLVSGVFSFSSPLLHWSQSLPMDLLSRFSTSLECPLQLCSCPHGFIIPSWVSWHGFQFYHSCLDS